MFVTPDATTQAPATTTSKGNNAPKTTIAYANCYLPLKDGTRIKLFNDFTLRFVAERVGEAKLIEMLRSGQITAEQIASKIQIEISLARDESAPIEFDFDI